ARLGHLSGKSLDLNWRTPSQRAYSTRITLRQKSNFTRRFKPIPLVQSSREKYSVWPQAQISRMLRGSCALQEGRARRHGRWVRDGGGGERQKTKAPRADGEVVGP